MAVGSDGQERAAAPWQGGGRALRRFAGRLVDLILPPTCPACRARVGSAGGLCIDCWRKIVFLERPWCERLGTPLPLDLGAGVLSAAAVAEPPVYGRARSAVAYDEVVADLVHAFKYGDRTDLAPMFGSWMSRVAVDLLAGADLIVPIPLHWTRLASRRFNQAAMLAHDVSRRTGLACRTDILVRRKKTAQQVGLGRQARERNMRGAFAVPAGRRAALAGKAVILVDDVLTTGATLSAASGALLAAGARSVDVLTLARVVGPA